MTTNETIIRLNIRETITAAIAEGTTGMSLNNLFHVTPTTGVACSVADYRLLFGDVAAKVAKEMKFGLL
jgi:hypothetical protein